LTCDDSARRAASAEPSYPTFLNDWSDRLPLAVYFVFFADLIVLAVIDQQMMLIILPVVLGGSYALLAVIGRFLMPPRANRG